MRKVYLAIVGALVGVISFSAAAVAGTEVTPPEGNLLDLAKPVYEAVMHGQWWLAASLALVFAVAAFKKYAPGKAGAWAKTDVGGSLLVLIGSFGGALATGLTAAGTGAVSMALAWTALKVAIGASGGYSLLKKLVMPYVAKLADKAPTWLKPVLGLVLWAFDSNTATIKEAEKAGEDAVKNNPGTGANGVVGAPTEI